MNNTSTNNYNITETMLKRTRFTTFNCAPKLGPDFIGGRLYDDNFNFTKIEVKTCDSTTRSDCKTKEEITAKLKLLRFRSFYLSVNFDGQDIVSPMNAVFQTLSGDQLRVG